MPGKKTLNTLDSVYNPEPEEVEAPSPRLGEGRGPKELAKLLQAYPWMINRLSDLDVAEREEGLEPTPWCADPRDLLEEAKAFNTLAATGSDYINDLPWPKKFDVVYRSRY